MRHTGADTYPHRNTLSHQTIPNSHHFLKLSEIAICEKSYDVTSDFPSTNLYICQLSCNGFCNQFGKYWTSHKEKIQYC